MPPTDKMTDNNNRKMSVDTAARTNKSAELVKELRTRFMNSYEQHKYDGKITTITCSHDLLSAVMLSSSFLPCL